MMFQSVPVCMFHHVNEHSGDFITVSTANFEKMMTMLAHENYATLSSEQFLLYKLGIVSVPRKSVLLTFDDAWLDTYINAFPIMRRYGHQFTIFVVSDRTSASSQFERSGNPASFPKHAVAERLLDSPGIGEVVCNWKDLSDMLDSGLCSIENHTATHGKTQNLDFDIARGREEIRKVLGASANQLCWPCGRHDSHDLAIAQELGIDITYLVRRGVNIPRLWNMKIKRFTVEDRDAAWFKRQLEIFSRPLYGYLYSRIKPDRWLKKPPAK